MMKNMLSVSVDNFLNLGTAVNHRRNSVLTQSTELLNAQPVELSELRAEIEAMRRNELSGYRLSIYSFNAVLLVLLVVFSICSYFVLQERWLWLFSITTMDYSIVYLYIGVLLQFFCIILGCFSVYCSCRKTLRIYWFATVLLLAGDVVIGMVWVYRFANMHETFPSDMERLFLRDSQSVDSNFCQIWPDIQRELKCCGLKNSADYNSSPLLGNRTQICDWAINTVAAADGGGENSYVPGSCWNSEDFPEDSQCSSSAQGCPTGFAYQRGCTNRLLLWLQEKADILFIVGYALLFLLKLVYVFILRKEMSELIIEIFQNNHKHLIHSWIDTDCRSNENTPYYFQQPPGMNNNNNQSNNRGSRRESQPEIKRLAARAAANTNPYQFVGQPELLRRNDSSTISTTHMEEGEEEEEDEDPAYQTTIQSVGGETLRHPRLSAIVARVRDSAKDRMMNAAVRLSSGGGLGERPESQPPDRTNKQISAGSTDDPSISPPDTNSTTTTMDDTIPPPPVPITASGEAADDDDDMNWGVDEKGEIHQQSDGNNKHQQQQQEQKVRFHVVKID